MSVDCHEKEWRHPMSMQLSGIIKQPLEWNPAHRQVPKQQCLPTTQSECISTAFEFYDATVYSKAVNVKNLRSFG
jgi:hypothetical protein